MSALITVDWQHLISAKSALAALSGSLPIAVARALTVTAHAVNRQIRVDMGARIAGGPTPYTLRSFTVQMATQQTLSAEIKLRDTPDAAGRGTPYERSLGHLFRPGNGPRQYKRIEKLLELRGLLPAGKQIVPGPALPLDARGNPRPDAIKTMLGILRSPIRNLRSVRWVNKRGAQRAAGFFVVLPGSPASGHLVPGIWQRLETGSASVVRQWFRMVSPPGYRQLFNLPAIAQPVVDRHFAPAIDQSLDRFLGVRRP